MWTLERAWSIAILVLILHNSTSYKKWAQKDPGYPAPQKKSIQKWFREEDGRSNVERIPDRVSHFMTNRMGRNSHRGYKVHLCRKQFTGNRTFQGLPPVSQKLLLWSRSRNQKISCLWYCTGVCFLRQRGHGCFSPLHSNPLHSNPLIHLHPPLQYRYQVQYSTEVSTVP